MDERGDIDVKYEHLAFAAARSRVLELKEVTELAARTRTAEPLVAFEARYRDAYERDRASRVWSGDLDAIVARAGLVLAQTARANEAPRLCADVRRRPDSIPVARMVDLIGAIEYLERARRIPGYPVLLVDAVVNALARLLDPVDVPRWRRTYSSLEDELLERYQTALELCADPWAPNIGLGGHHERIEAGTPPPLDVLIDRKAYPAIAWIRRVRASEVYCATTDLDAIADELETQGIQCVTSYEQARELLDEQAAAEDAGEPFEGADLWIVRCDSEVTGEQFAAALDAYAAAIREVDLGGGALLAWTTKSGSL